MAKNQDYDPKAIIDEIGKYLTIKENKYGPPYTYLGVITEKVQLDVGSYAWSMHSKNYVYNLILTIMDLLLEDGRELKGTFKQKTHSGPLPTSYKPELDDRQLCSEEHVSRFRKKIGILRWAVELGRLDILLEVLMMSQYLAEPQRVT